MNKPTPTFTSRRIFLKTAIGAQLAFSMAPSLFAKTGENQQATFANQGMGESDRQMIIRPGGIAFSSDLKTRSEIAQLVRDMFDPLLPHFSEGGACVKLGETAASFTIREEELEGFSRPLWGLAPLVAGGGTFDHWDIYQKGMANGSNPQHPDFWGWDGGKRRQMHVEMAAIGLALALVPEKVWEPLSAEAKGNLYTWLRQIYPVELVPNNWQLFRVMAHLGLTHVGEKGDVGRVEDSFRQLEGFYLGDGWYSDGKDHASDYYIPWAIHFYSLIYSRIAGDRDPKRADLFRERAKLFAKSFIHWFAADGSAIPYGRSLTYRFAQGSFWGALAFANVEALPWGVIKGLALRNLRWWLKQPILDANGILTVGYGYPNLHMSEIYNSPCSPYWAFKMFLPLALSETHPFWKAEEEPLPNLPRLSVQKHPGFIFTRDEASRHVCALNISKAGEKYTLGQDTEKYGKFAYSNLFGFSVSKGTRELEAGAYDNALTLSEEGTYWRTRKGSIRYQTEDSALFSEWQPWPDVKIQTWLIPAGPWHVRVHKISTGRKLIAAEGGFSTSQMDEVVKAGLHSEVGAGFAQIAAPPLGSGLRDLNGSRAGEVHSSWPNTNLLFPKSQIPFLKTDLAPGEHMLVAAVLGTATLQEFDDQWKHPPHFHGDAKVFSIFEGKKGGMGNELYKHNSA